MALLLFFFLLKAKARKLIRKASSKGVYYKSKKLPHLVIKRMMMMIRSQENLRNKSIGISDDHIIPTCTCPTWKLYENPFYNSQNPLEQDTPLRIQHNNNNNKQIHRLNLPISARKIAASFWDLTFIRPFMDSHELEIARAQVAELKAKVEHERKARKKLEWMNKKIARELSEEKKGREALERVCEELANHKAEMNRLRKDMEEERKMMRVAEVMREERVQMKLTEAKYLLEDKLLELEATKKMLQTEQKIEENINNNYNTSSSAACDNETGTSRPDHKSINQYQVTIHRRNHSQEAENPHIKRGIKGFVEFPKVVRAISSKSRHWGTKLECQKAQLRILLKQKCPIRSNVLLTTS